MSLTTARCCGSARTKGSLYLEIAQSPLGLPLSAFLLCPPVKVDIDQLGISEIGMHLIHGPAYQDVYFIADWIGADYPNVWDFLTEGDLINFSRKIPPSFPFEKLSRESRYVPIHPRGHIENFGDYFFYEPDELPPLYDCAQRERTGHKAHKKRVLRNAEMCMRLWRQDLNEGTEVVAGRFATRTLPCGGKYEGLLRPLNGTDGTRRVIPLYAPAMIASLPIGRIVGVKAEDGSHLRKLEKAAKGPFPVTEVEF